MALTQYIGQVENPQVAFSIRQQRPTSLIEAVSATIEMESYLKPIKAKSDRPDGTRARD